ncbi:MAG: hypothetical protein GY795_48840 [Desulfobacterales bacterium]|nr:hypothetical protein [Desulfobacterales bacterium]
MDNSEKQLLQLAIYLIILISYFLIILIHALRKKSAYSVLAKKLNGEYTRTGFLKPGKITGNYKGKLFHVEPYSVSAGLGKGTYYKTSVKVSCKHEKHGFIIYSKFFKKFPNWKHVRRDIIKDDFFMRYQEIDENDKIILLKYFEGLGIEKNPKPVLKLLKSRFSFIGHMAIDNSYVSVHSRGVVQNENKIINSLDFLKKVSDNIGYCN